MNLLIVENQSHAVLTLPDVVAFETVETEKRAGGWLGKEPGIIRPRLDWRTEILQAAETSDA